MNWRGKLFSCQFDWQKNVLYNSRGLDVISLLVKYYVPLAHINKVIKLLKFKSTMNLQCFWWKAQSRTRHRMRFRNRMRSLDCASHQKHCKFIADLNFKSFITRDGGKWWSKDHHLVVVKILKNVDFSLKNVKKLWKKVIKIFAKL